MDKGKSKPDLEKSDVEKGKSKLDKGKSDVEKGISVMDKGISLPGLVISAVDLPQWKPQKGMSWAGNPAPERDKPTSKSD
jgi:hypothetical protein